MSMGSNLHTVIADSIIYNLVVVGRHLVEALLNDMVTIEIFDQGHYISIQSIDNGSGLKRTRSVSDLVSL
jgi:hypothetical protein